MRYMLMIVGREDWGAGWTEEQLREKIAAHAAFSRELQGAGVGRGGAKLQGSSEATTIRRTADGFVRTDGPYAETKELLGGFYTVEVDSPEAAIEWAKKRT